MLRPIDVIFKHPVKKFTVIYQNGKLWQLPRLAFDGNSLAHKRPYQGSREQIFVAANQTLDSQDIQLMASLVTIDLPSTMIGRNVDDFEHWWQTHWFDYRDELAQKRAHQDKIRQSQAQGITNPNLVLPVSAANEKIIPSNAIAQPQRAISPPPPVSSQSLNQSANNASSKEDIFDSMMADLTKNL